MADAEAIRTIYNHEVLSTTATFDLVPRSLEDQQQWLAARSGAVPRRSSPSTWPPVQAAPDPTDETDGEVVGFAACRRIASVRRTAPAWRTRCTSDDRGGQGIGTLLLGELLDIAEGSGFHSASARIEATGEASRRALHARCGFRLVGIERETGRKFNRWLDVALMQCLLHERHQR